MFVLPAMLDWAKRSMRRRGRRAPTERLGARAVETGRRCTTFSMPHTTPRQIRYIAAKMRTPQELKEWSAEDQREIRWF